MIKLGRHTYCGKNDIDCYEGVDLTIGNFCSIGSGLKILSGTHPCIEYPDVVSTYPFKEQWHVNYPPSKMGGKVTIGNDVWIATDVSILEGVTIGDGAIIGAKSVVTRDVPAYTFVAGNPAKVKKVRFEVDLNSAKVGDLTTWAKIAKLLKIKWWDWDDEAIIKAMPQMKDIDEFIKKYS